MRLRSLAASTSLSLDVFIKITRLAGHVTRGNFDRDISIFRRPSARVSFRIADGRSCTLLLIKRIPRRRDAEGGGKPRVAQHCNSVLDFPFIPRAFRCLLALPRRQFIPRIADTASTYFPKPGAAGPELERWRRERQHRATPLLHHHHHHWGLKAGNTRDLKPRTRA